VHARLSAGRIFAGPARFGSIFSTLFIPLSFAALGIVLRGSRFAFHHTARRLKGRQVAQRLFGISSLLTPFFMGTVVGAVAGGGCRSATPPAIP
jgi:cytochrome bd ubiquinol oxidase subunit II